MNNTSISDAVVNCAPTDIVYWGMENCVSFVNDPTTFDYSEFLPGYPSFGGCSTVSAGNIYRNEGYHSCTDGAPGGGSVGMCVDLAGVNTWSNNSPLAIRFEVTLDPSNVGQLAELRFYEKGPETIQIANGSLRSNNYPQKYGIRVLKNGEEIFKQIEVATSQDWSLETFNFSSDPDFTITTSTTFVFELLAYDAANTNGIVTVWDVDNFTIAGFCGNCQEICNNNIDDDGDGAIDEADADCCNEVTYGGEIGSNEILCGSNPNPSEIMNIASPSGGSGDLEYLWMSSTSGCPDQIIQAIPGATNATYDPGPISQTTWYTRCARRAGCNTWDFGETNCVKKEVTGNCGSGAPESWSYDCEDGITVDMIGQGINCNDNATINIPNPGNVTQIYAEVVYKGNTINPGFYTFNTDNETVTIEGVKTNPSGGYYYRTVLQAAPSVSISIPAANKCKAQTFILYVFRNDPNAGGSSGVFVESWLYHSEVCKTLPIEAGPAPRDIDIIVPLSELTNDGRIVNITASAGGVSKTITIDNFNQGNSLNITPFVLSNVPATATSVEICVESPTGTPNGQSLVFSGGIKVAPVCLACDASDLSGTANVISDYNNQDISCKGANDGRAEMAPAGGLPPYNFQWNNGQNGQIINNLSPGNYAVTLTDSYGCSVTNSVTVSEPTLVTIDVAVSSDYKGQNITCFDANDGAAQATANGGTPPYSYNWVNGQTNQTATGLSATTYTVIASDVNGCTAEESVTLTQPSTLDGNANITSDYNGQDVSCTGDSDGSASVIASGGTSPYTYKWSNNQTGSNATGLSAETYTVTITDVNNCSVVRNVSLQDPPVLSLTAQISSDFNGAVITCFGENDGAATATANGGTGAYTYKWSNNQTGNTANNLVAGSYTVTATDANGCSETASVLLEAPEEVGSQIDVISNYSGSQISCNGASDGSAIVNTTGGVLPYTYKWSDNQSTQTASNLAAGNYIVTVTDANACSTIATVSFTEPEAITCSAGVTSSYSEGVDISTLGGNDGRASITVNGGTGNYNYQWNDANFQTNQEATNLVAGDYTVQVSDENGCTCTAPVTLLDPAKIGNLIFEDTNGNGVQDPGEVGIANVSVTLIGTTNDGTQITRTITTDANGNYDFDGLLPGSYKITVTPPNNYLITYPNETGTEATDSDLDPNNGMSNNVTVTNGQYYPDLDGGVFAPAKIGDYVWKDCNKNGLQENGEEPLGFAPVTLSGRTGNGTALSLTTTTDGNGFYEFVNLRPGIYTLTFGFPNTPTGMEFSPKNQGEDNADSDVDVNGKTDPIVLKSGEDNNSIDAGYIDATAPTLTPASDLTVQCDGSGNTIALNDWLSSKGGAQATDNWSAVSNITWTNDFNTLSDDCGATGSATVTFTATDECGNSSQTTATFKIEDSIVPSIETPASNLTVECDGGGNGNDLTTWLESLGGAGATDICGGVTWTNTFPGSLSDECGATGTTSVTFIATDDCNNSSETTATFTIVDTTPPTITSPANDLTVECDGQGNEINLNAWLDSFGGALASDVCGPNLTWSNNYTALTPACGGTASTTVTFTVKDECGNPSETTATFTIVDTTLPDLGIEAANLTVECDGGGNGNEFQNWLNTQGGAGATDICSNVAWTNDFSGSLSDDCGATGSTTITFTATDACANSSQTTATFTIVDTTVPTIASPAENLSVECDGQGNQINLDFWLNSNAGALASDVCGNVTWTNSFSNNLSDDCAATGSVTVTFIATDDCGNASESIATFTIIDTTPPNIGINATSTIVECDGGGNGNELQSWLDTQGGAGATDLCGEVTWTNNFSGSLTDECGATGSATVTFTASDACGNNAETTATFTIEDTREPTITGTAQNLTVECDGQGNQVNIDAWLNSNAGALASDLCGSNITWSNSYSGLSDDCAATGMATITFTATDECGNAATSSATLIIEDTTAPDIGVEAENLSVECDGQGNQIDLTNWLISNGGAGATEICGNITWTNNFTTINNDCGLTGSATVTFTATDDCDNASQTTATFTITDTSVPTLIGVPADVTVECNEVPALANPSASDVCDPNVSIAFNEEKVDGDCLDTYTLKRTWTAIDACGNVDVKTQTITVEDNTNPVLLGVPTDITVECDAVLEAATLAVSDNCDLEVDLSFVEIRTAGNCDNNYTLTRTWTATDNCGNQDIQTQIVTVQDLTNPSLIGVPADAIVECDAIPTVAEPTASDNCDTEVTVTFNEIQEAGNCTNNYTLKRTWTATDNCGNQDTQTQTITVQDSTDPVLIGVPANVTVECDALPTVAEPSASDNCDDEVLVFYNELRTDGPCADSYTLTRSWTATDDCGNTSVEFQVITVQDTTEPTITGVPGDLTVECDAIPSIPAIGSEVLVTDNCDANVVLTFNEVKTSNGCTDSYTLTRTWTAIDACNNQNIQKQIITVEDTTNPTLIGVPTDTTVECDAVPTVAEPTASDNCDTAPTVSFNEIRSNGNCENNYTLTRTWTATDNCGNQDIQTQVVTVEDNTNPELLGVPADASVECDAVPTAAQPTATDNCDVNVNVTFNEVETPTSCADSYILTRTWTASDACGNQDIQTQVITVEDNTNPTLIGVPGDVIVECDAIPTVEDPTASDNCDTEVTITFNETRANGNCENNYTLTRTWTATDNCGNQDIQSQVISVEDNTAPILAGVPTDITVACDAIPTEPTVFVSDNCDDQVDLDFNEVRTNGSCPDAYTLTRTWTATDACGNENKQTQIITVEDNTQPELIGVPSDESVDCDAVPTAAEPTATDNCDIEVAITFVETEVPGDCPNSFVLKRTWTATDNCGNKEIQTQTINVQDDSAPELIDVPGDLTVECDAIPTQAEPTATDNCDTEVTITFNENRTNGGCADTYTLTRTWTATDDCGNQDIQTQVITVEDTTDPELVGVPGNETVECDAIPTPAEPTATDNCDIDVTISFNEVRANGSCVDNYTLTRTWTASDECGNRDVQTQVITVEDTTDPELVGVPGDETVDCDAIPSPAQPTATDNCTTDVTVTFNETQTNADCANSYTLTRTWTASDNCGNKDIQTQVITVEDNAAPQLLDVPSDMTADCDAIPSPAEPTATDNCDTDVTVTFNEVRTNGDCSNNYILTRTWTASDACGNQDIQTQVITVRDNTDPELIGVPGDETVECNAIPAVAEPTATDNCDINIQITFNENKTNGDCPNNYTLTRTWTATDACGNKNTQTQIITVEDTRAPELIGVPADMTADCNTVPNPANPTATDNCDVNVAIDYQETQTAGSCTNNYTLTRIWTATDLCGNKDIQTQVITVEDNTNPILLGVPGNETVECDAIPSPADPSATDNCEGTVQVSFNEVRTNGACSDSYTLTRTWTATDLCGNQAKETQIITVEDNTNPELIGVPGNETVECDAIPTVAEPTATDNCDIEVQIIFNENRTNGTCPDSYTLTRTWTATDNCGNKDIQTQVISVEDTTAPSLDGVPGDMTAECDAVPDAPSISTFTASDNCDIETEITFSETLTPGSCVNNYTITRTWTATDDCGNQNKQTQTITVEDTQAPNLVGIPADVSASCGETPSTPVIGSDIMATDNCDVNVTINFTETVTEGNCAESYILTRTWTATDNCGNQDKQTQIVTIGDDAPPAITGVPDDLTVECGAIPSPANPTATDDCDTEVEVSFNETQVAGDCPGSYSLIRTWTAVDNCDNEVTGTQTITVRDVTNPELIGVPGDITVDCNEVPDPVTNDVIATDNCDINVLVTFNETTENGACGNSYTITRTWTARDACGNQDIQTQVITVGDNGAPTLEGIPSDITVECYAIPSPANPTASDDCDANVTVNYEEVRTNGACTDGYTLTRTWSVSDECGNAASGVQIITVEDNTAPELIGIPQDLSVGCDEIPPVVGDDEVTATDNCDIDVTINFTETTIDGTCADTYVLVRTWTATDNCGNQDIQTQTISVGDNEGPTFVDVPGDLTVECGNVPTPANPSATDDCTEDINITFDENRTNGSCPDTYQLTRIWTATDNCGNQTIQTQIIVVEDTTAPELIGVPEDLSVDCSEIPPVPADDIIATDNCDTDVQVTFVEQTEAGDCASDIQIIRTWTATDDCGNKDIQTQIITVGDNEAPVIESAPADVTVECDNIPSPATLNATDDCDQDVVVEMNEERTNGSCKYNYKLTRTWTATDDCGKESKTTQVITVQDTTDPILLDVPGSITVNLSNGEVIPSVPQVTATDNCDIEVEVTFSENEETNDCGQIITRTWTATDNCGNSSTETQTISVTDLLSASITPEASFMCAGTSIQFTASPTSSVDYTYTWTVDEGSFDNSSIATPIYTNDIPGTYTVLVEISNGTGCSGSVSTTITVLEISPGNAGYNGPICEGDKIELTAAGGGNYSWTGPNGFASTEQNPTIHDATPADNGTYTVSLGSGDCEAVLEVDVIVYEEIQGDFNKVDVDCDTLGSIFIGVIGGTGNYTFDWADLPGSDDPKSRNNLGTGIYSLTVSDGPCVLVFDDIEIVDNCEGDCGASAGSLMTANALICMQEEAGGPTLLTATPVGNDVVLPGFSKVFVLTSGEELMVEKLNNEPEFTVNKAALYRIHSMVYNPGSFSIGNIELGTTTGFEVNDMLSEDGDCGSYDLKGVTILVSNVETTIDNQSSELCGSANGQVNLSPSDEYTYAWSDGGTGANRTDLTAGNYEILAVNQYGCEKTYLLQVGSLCSCIEPAINNIVIVETNCGESDGSARIDMEGNPQAYDYTWFPNTGTSNGVGNERTGLIAGVYSVTITDPTMEDCFIVQEFGIGNVDGPEPVEIITEPASCQAFNGKAWLTPDTYNYIWLDGFTGGVRGDLTAGSYQVIVVDPDAPDCPNIAQVEIGETNELEAESVTITQPTCGENNGSVEIIITGGGPDNVKFEWSDGVDNFDSVRAGLGSGTYTVTVTQQTNLCQTELTFVLTDDVVGANVILTPSVVVLDCAGEDNGSVDFTVSTFPGFVEPYVTKIEDGNGNTYVNGNLGVGAYCLVVLDDNKCVAGSSCFDVIDPEVLDVGIAAMDKTCEDDGSITIEVNGGNGGYTYDWSDLGGSQNVQNRNDLDAGIYSVVVSDSEGCSVEINGLIIENECAACESAIVNNVVVFEATCDNENGSATITLVGNENDYDYDWSPNIGNSNSAGNTRTQLPVGTYEVEITNEDDPTCSITEIFTIGNVDGPQANITTTPATCSAADGTASASPTNFEYLWSDGLPGINRSTLLSGIYQVTVIDPNTDCINVLTVVIEEENDLDAEVVINNLPECEDNDGSVTINVSGGSGSYNYSWGATDTRDNLPSGIYEVQIFDLNEGCKTTVVFALTDDVVGADIDIDSDVAVSCIGENDGGVDFDVDLEPGFETPSKTTIEDAAGAIYQNGDLAPGNYCIIVRDANLCLAAQSCFEVQAATAINVDVTFRDIDCDDLGSIELAVTGGAGDYRFDWQDVSGSNNDRDRDNLEEGNYDVVITDANGCSVEIEDIDIDDKCGDVECEDPVINNIVIIEATCGNDNGKATIVVAGDPNDYDYQWQPNVSDSNVADNIPAGTYLVTIFDENNPACQTVEIFTIMNTDGPEATIVSTSPANCLANDGEADLSPSSFDYLWSDNGTGADRDDLPAGTYQVTVTESGNACQNFLTVIIEEDNDLELEAIINQEPDCQAENGSVTIDVDGGTGDYSYSWGSSNTRTDLGSGLYTVAVVDNGTGCSSDITFVLVDDVVGASIDIENPGDIVTLDCAGDNNGEVDFDLDLDNGFAEPAIVEILDANGDFASNGALTAGTYCITVKDDNDCLAAQECFLVVQPEQIDVVVITDDQTCTGFGAINLEVTGGNGNYTFDWEDLNGADNPQNRTDLTADFYDVVITDSEGCSVSIDDIRVKDVCDPTDCVTPLVQSVVTIESKCELSIGSATINMVGDEDDYTYTWTPDVSDSNTASNLPSGVYTVIIAEANNPSCFTEEIFAIGNGDGPQTTILSTTPATCTSDNGTAVLSPPDFVYEWCNGAIGFNVINLPSGSCFVTVTSPATGCTNILEVIIEEINTLVVDVDVTQQPDCNDNDGEVEVNVTGGSSDYNYLWSDGGSGSDRDNLSSGVYTVTIIDNGDNACSEEVTFVLTDDVVGGEVTIEDDPVFVSCIGEEDATVDFDFDPDGGFLFPADITIVDANGNTAQNGDLAVGTYCVIVNDENGCLAAGACFKVEAPEAIDLDIILNNITCDTFGMILVSVNGGNGGYTFDWADLPGSNNPQNRDSVGVGSYDLTVTDSKGCIAAVENLIILDECSNCPSPDTVQVQLPVNDQVIYCFELESCFDAAGTTYTTIDESLTGGSNFGNWVLGADGCLTYNSNTTPGIGVDTICIVANFNGISDTTCVIITITSDCDVYSGPDVLDAATCTSLTEICLDIPIETILDYTFEDNGQPYTNGFMGCNSDSIITYLANSFLPPNLYTLDNWILNGDTFSIASFVDAQQVVDSMNVWDTNGNWMLNGILIEGGDFTNMYGDIVIAQGGIVTSTANPNIQLIPSGAAISLDTGFHQVVVTNLQLGCTDTLNLTIGCNQCFDEVYTGLDTLMANDCDSLTELCLNLNLDNLLNYTISDNGTAYNGGFAGCNFDSLLAYSISGFFEPSFYTLNSWRVNNVFFSMGNFLSVDELVDSMNVWDPAGNWMIDGLTIQGGDFSNEYGSIVVAQFGTVIATAEPNLQLLPNGVEIALDTGFHEVIVMDTIFGCLDTFSVTINCDNFQALPTDTIDLEILLGFTDTICLDTTVLPGIIDTIYNICEAESGLAIDFTLISDYCYEYTAVELGTNPACIVICDEQNHCDTTIIRVTSLPAISDTFSFDIPFSEADVFCIDTTELAGTIDTIYNYCEDASGEFVDFTINDSTFCITYEGLGVGQDTACIVICDDLGYCDSTVLIVTGLLQLGEGPIAIDDDTLAILNIPVIIDVLENDSLNGVFIGIDILTQPANGTAILNPDFTITYAPDRDFCEAVDSFQYVLNTSTGSDTAWVTINVLCDELTIYSGFSPNGDGTNDTFTILGIDQFPNNEVWIFNRWGNEVFRTKEYSNANGWDGTWNGKDLPDGTYFYVIDDGEGRQYSGYIQIQR